MLARSRGGRLLTSAYMKNSYKYDWECAEGHQWKAVWDSVKRGSWCPVCAGKVVDKGKRLERLRNRIVKRGGTLLSTECLTVDAEIEIRCRRDHIFKTTYDRFIYQKSWCPSCREPLGERLTRAILERYLETKLPKKRPAWLLNETGRRMEFDGYSKEKGIAFEFNGIQHYRRIEYFHSKKSFDKQIDRDNLKRSLSKENGVVLLEINGFDINYEKLPLIIAAECLRKGLAISVDPSAIDIDQIDLASNQQYEELRKICTSKGLKLKTKNYLGYEGRYQVECERCGVSYRRGIKTLRRTTGCESCVQKDNLVSMRLGNREMESVAAKYGGKFLGPNYTNVDAKYDWKCNSGHTFTATGYTVRSKSTWCPYCAGTNTGGRLRPTIQDFKEIARLKGGECLSSEYINAHTKIKFRCKRGHEWEASANSIKRGSWCRKCRWLG